MGAKVLRKVQFGTETTAGTAVDATTIMRWPPDAVMSDQRVIEVAEEAVGQRFGKGRTYQPSQLAVIEVPDHAATFEQLPYWLCAGIEGTTGVQDGTDGDGYAYQFDSGNTAAQTLTTYTIECGDGQECYRLAYGFVPELTLSGAAGEAVMVSGTWNGRQVSDATLTTDATLPAVEEILFGNGKLYIDAAGGTIGTTQQTSTWLGFSLTIPTGFKPLFSGDGNTYFTVPIWSPEDPPELELTIRNDAFGAALTDAAKAGTVLLVRMTFTGSALTTGNTYTTKLLQISCAVLPTEVPDLEDDGGEDTRTFTFQVVDSDSTQLQIVVVNQLSALP